MDQVVLRRSLGLYLVADLSLRPTDLPRVVRSCIDAGVSCIQVRGKNQDPERILAIARALQPMCRSSSVPLIINDHLDIALETGADGVHLGVDDVDPELARKLGGQGFIIGFSPETDEQLRNAGTRGVSYLGIGPLFGTTTKHDAGASLGTEECARRVSLTRLPTVAIGGIDPSNAHLALGTGADGVAVVSSILKADDPAQTAAKLRSVVDAADPSARSRH